MRRDTTADEAGRDDEACWRAGALADWQAGLLTCWWAGMLTCVKRCTGGAVLGAGLLSAASQRRKKREARSKALHVELVPLRLWVCGRNPDAALVLGELLVPTSLRCKRCSEGRARIARRPALGAGEAKPGDGGMTAAEYGRKREQAGRRR